MGVNQNVHQIVAPVGFVGGHEIGHNLDRAIRVLLHALCSQSNPTPDKTHVDENSPPQADSESLDIWPGVAPKYSCVLC